MVEPPQGAPPRRLDQRRAARPGIAFRCLPRAIDADHEEGQAPRAHPAQRRQPMRHLLEPRAEPPLEQGDIITTRLARSEEHTSELQSLMRISYAVFCLKKKKKQSISHTKRALMPRTLHHTA